MTPAQILAIIKDVAIIAGLIFVVLWIRNDGKNVVKIQDLQAVQKQLAANAAQEAAWATQRQQAEVQHAQDIQAVSAAVNAHSAPIIVRVPANPSPLPGTSPTATGANPGRGGSDDGPRIDLRPAVSAFERKYETAFADCRSALSQWP